MRDLKFRVWSNLLQRFAVDTEFSHILYQNEDFSNGTFSVGGADCEIQQFFGRCDKNGKEIYENDIISVNGLKFLCEWKNHGFKLTCLADKEQKLFDGYRIDLNETCESMVEVLGNIYENPELLKN